MKLSMDWGIFAQRLVMAAGMTMVALGFIGLATNLSAKVRTRFGRSYGVLTLAWVVTVLAWLAVVSGAVSLSFGGG